MTRSKRLAVLDAPSNLGLEPPAENKVPSVYKMPEALRANGLLQRLNATDAGRVAPPAYSFEFDRTVGIRNHHAIAAFTPALADRVEQLAGDHFVIVLGGDCSILLGPMLALRRRGRYGLIFVDGQTDTRDPTNSKTAGAAGMDLALAVGHGPNVLADLEARKPLVRGEDVIVFGARDVLDRGTYIGQDISRFGMALYDLNRVRRMGVCAAAANAVGHVTRPAMHGFWIHVDADVLDSHVMPAVDTPQPGGMTFEELVQALRVMLASDRAVGMELTIFDPDRDQDGRLARAFTDAIVQAFA
jgi:arginase